MEGSVVRHDYQEIKIQESTQVLGVGSIPRSILVILKDDLVDLVKAGGTDVRGATCICFVPEHSTPYITYKNFVLQQI